jgi:quinol-cytochrome oxidoreductase complex cytochrome b subunit
MSADYRQQYRPDQLEPFWPNEIVKMVVAVLCTLSLIMFLAILPVLLEAVGIHGIEHHEEPANPRGATPAGIKPEWYFLATYQYLRLMPTQFLGVSGKTWGVLSQGLLVPALVLLPFWYRRRASRRPGMVYRLAVTAGLAAFLVLTIWGGWPEEHVEGEERLVPLMQYVRERPMVFILIGSALLIFYALIMKERRAIREVLGDGPAEDAGEGTEEGRP